METLFVKTKNNVYGTRCAACEEDIRRGSYVAAFRKERLVAHYRCRNRVIELTEALREAMK